MSNWISITVDDLNDTKVAGLVTALRTAALGEGQDDPSPRMIQAVVDRIRAEVKGWARNQLDADMTKIPKDLKEICTRLVIVALKNRLEMSLSDLESKLFDADESYLRRVASGAVPIAEPENPIEGETQVVSGTPRVRRKRLRMGQRQQEGV